jgi:hypothetical protein
VEPDPEPSTLEDLQIALRAAHLEIEYLKLTIAKLKHEQYGQTSERGKRLMDQLALQLEEIEATAAEEEIKAEEKIPRPDRPTREKPKRNHSQLICPVNVWSFLGLRNIAAAVAVIS